MEVRRNEVAVKTLEFLIKSAAFEEAAAAADQAFSDGLINRGRWEEFALFLWSDEARKLSSGGNWLEGWLFLSQAPSQTQSISRWNAMEETYRHNAVITYHNRFARAVQRKKLSEARQILIEALDLFPDAAILREDQQTIENLESSES